ncbi:MAG: hypothetical protein ABIK09_08575 [Pseudomonadota bacterium]
MTGNGDLPPKDNDVGKKPDEVTPEIGKPAAAVPPPTPTAPAPRPPAPVPKKEEAKAPPPPPPPPPASGDINVTERIELYEKTVRLNSIVRVAFPLLVLSTIVVFLIATWLTIWGAFPEKAINNETILAGEQLMPYFNKVIKAFADDVAPEIIEEFEIKLAAASDAAIQKFSAEIDYLQKSNEQFIKDQATLAIKDKRGSHKELLARLYPDLAEDPDRLDAMADTVNQAFEHWTVAYMTRVMADYFDTMGQINETVVKSYTAPAKKEGDGQPKVVEAEMLELFMELINAAYEEPAAETVKDGETAPAEKTQEPSAPVVDREEAPVEAPAEPAGEPAETL